MAEEQMTFDSTYEPPQDFDPDFADYESEPLDDNSIGEEELPALEELRPVMPMMGNGWGKLVPRPYQGEATDGIFRDLRLQRSTLAVLATGLGKTIIAAEVAIRWPAEEFGRVLFLAHRKELIDQGAEKIGEHLDEECGIEMADRSEARQGRSLTGRSRVLVGSVQTMCRPNRLKPYKPEDFGLVIFDEAHHATANTYKTIIGYFQQNAQCRFLGITATPDRADGALLGEIFESVAYKMDILDGITDGWLVPIHQRFVVVEGLDFSSCRTTAGDLNEKDLERAMAGANPDELGADEKELTEEQVEARKKQEQMLHAVADPTIREANGRPGIVFCVTIDHAEKMAAVFRRYAVTAEAVTMKTTPDERADHVAAFKSGRLQFLIGVGVFTEGFDAPNAAVIAVARPTKSRALYTQMVGRATRPDLAAIAGKETALERVAAIEASGKPHATVLDFVGNSGRHKLISTADILGEAFPEDLRAAVIAMLRQNAESADIRAELAGEQARRELMAKLKAEQEAKRKEERRLRYLETVRRMEEEAKLRKITAAAAYKTREVDPFGEQARYQKTPDEFKGGASEKQVAYLAKLGIPYDKAIGFTGRQAGAVINERKALKGSDWRVFFGKHKGKSLAEACADRNWLWWIRNAMEDGGLKTEVIENLNLMELEREAQS